MKVLIVISVFLALAFGELPVYRQQNQQQRRYYFARQEEETTPFAPTEVPTPAEAPYPASGWKPDGPTFDLPQRQVGNSYVPSRSFGSRSPTVKQQYGAPDSQPAEVQPQENQQQQQQQQRFGNSQFQARQQQQQQQQQQFSASQNQFQQRHYLAAVFQPQINQYGVPEPQEQFQPPRPDQEYGVPLTTTEEPATTTEIEDSTTTSTPQTDSEVEPVNSVNELDEEGDLDEQQAQQQRQQGEYYVALPDGRLQRIRYVSHQDIEAMKYFARIRAENVEPLRGPIYSYSPLQEVQFAPTSLRLAPNSADSSSASNAASSSSAKLELQEEAAPSPPLAAVVQYPYDAPSSVIPLGGASSYSANYRVPASTERRYFISF